MLPSNFSKEGKESKHNLAYWERTEYLGFGAGASSCFKNLRFSNEENLEKYMKKHNKTVIKSYVTGGSDDGGIDGVIETVDLLGFRETTMVQMKNRAENSSETDVRGFYGAVCAKQGSRGIFATTAGFHSSALSLLDSIPNCVGVDGDKIFSMAIETGYGIKKTAGELSLDEKII